MDITRSTFPPKSAPKDPDIFERETATSDLVKYYYFVIIVIIIVIIHYKFILIKIKFRFRGLLWELFVKLKMFSNRFLYMVFGCKCPNTIFSPKPRGKAITDNTATALGPYKLDRIFFGLFSVYFFFFWLSRPEYR